MGCFTCGGGVVVPDSIPVPASSIVITQASPTPEEIQRIAEIRAQRQVNQFSLQGGRKVFPNISKRK